MSSVTAPPELPGPGEQEVPRRLLDCPDVWFALAMVVAVVPILVAALGALVDGWVVVGDNGYFLLRARDVLTEHTPLLGTWSSSSTVLGFDVNNPGPWLFYLFALPAKVGGDAGLVVAVAVINAASVLGVGWFLRRNGGPLVGVVGLVGAAGLAWTMGRPLLIDPWQPHSLLLAFLWFLVLAWCVAAGDRWALPWAVGVASVLVQSHLSYVYLAPAVGAVAVAGLGIGAWRSRLRDPDGWPSTRAGLRQVGVVTGAVMIVAWLPSLVEQVFASGRGNLGRLVEAAGSGAPTIGTSRGLRLSGEVLALWPTWLRPSFEADHPHRVPPQTAASVVGLLVLVGVLMLAGWWAWRRRDRLGFAGVAVAGVAAAAGSSTAVGLIATDFGIVAHHVRYLWPIAVMTQLAPAVVVVRSLSPRARRRALPVATALVVVLAVVNLPEVDRRSGPNGTLAAAPAVVAMRAQLEGLEGRGTVLVDFETRPFAEPFSGPFLAELGRRGIDFVLDEPGEVRQLGPSRAHDGEADVEVLMRWGPRAIDDPPIPEGSGTAERIVFASLLDDDELAEWERLRTQVGSGDVTEDELRRFYILHGRVLQGTFAAWVVPR